MILNICLLFVVYPLVTRGPIPNREIRYDFGSKHLTEVGWARSAQSVLEYDRQLLEDDYILDKQNQKKLSLNRYLVLYKKDIEEKKRNNLF